MTHAPHRDSIQSRRWGINVMVAGCRNAASWWGRDSAEPSLPTKEARASEHFQIGDTQKDAHFVSPRCARYGARRSLGPTRRLMDSIRPCMRFVPQTGKQFREWL